MIRERNGNKNLIIFDNFEVDTKLPKHKVKELHTANGISLGGSTGLVDWFGDTPSSYDRAFMEKLSFANGFWSAILYTFLMKTGIGTFIGNKAKKDKPLKAEVVKKFFESIKLAKKELNLHNSELLKKYEETITDAQIAGQVALVENLSDKMGLILMESKLIENGFPVYLEEKDLVSFYEKTESSKNLKLVWIKNFVRMIPKDIIAIKRSVDEFKIFDNYVILTFDPLNQMDQMTKKEVEKAKDPILFGVIKNSNKLYFIADWEDEHCNLRLEDVLKSLGKDKALLDNQSITVYNKK